MAQDNPFPNLGGLSYSEDVFYRILDDLLGVGVVGASDYQVIQNHLGADMSVDVQPGSAYVALTNGGKRRTRLPAQSNSGLPGSPNSADQWTSTFTSADATNPRIDRVVLTVQDSSVDGSGFYRSILRVVAGTPTSGATLVNLNGAAAVPANSTLLANVLVPNSSTTVTTANISDQRAFAKVGGGGAGNSIQTGIVNVATTVAGLGTGVAGKQGRIKVMPATYNNGGATALPASTITVGDTTGFATAGTFTTANGIITYTGKTATTFTGCTGGTGTLAAGATIVQNTVTSGSADVEFVDVVWDATLAKWVSGVTGAVYNANLSTNQTAVINTWVVCSTVSGRSLITLTSRWRWYDAAGLQPQARIIAAIATGVAPAIANPQLRNHFFAADLKDAVDTFTDEGADANSASAIATSAVQANSAHGAPQATTLWSQIPGGYTLKDALWIGFDFFCTTLGGAPPILDHYMAQLRWVG